MFYRAKRRMLLQRQSELLMRAVSGCVDERTLDFI